MKLGEIISVDNYVGCIALYHKQPFLTELERTGRNGAFSPECLEARLVRLLLAEGIDLSRTQNACMYHFSFGGEGGEGGCGGCVLVLISDKLFFTSVVVVWPTSMINHLCPKHVGLSTGG